MSDMTDRSKFLKDLHELVEQDHALMEVLEYIEECKTDIEEPKILMPYVSAPILTECAWN